MTPRKGPEHVSRLRRLRPQRWTQVSNQAIDRLPDPTAIGLLVVLLRFPEGSDLPPMDHLAATRWPGVGRRTLYAAMRDLVAYGHVVKIRYQSADGTWSTDTYLFDDQVTDDELAELAGMFPPGSRIECRRGVERITPDGVEPVGDLPTKRTRPHPGSPAQTPQKRRSDRPATTGRSVAGRSVADLSGDGRSREKPSLKVSLGEKNHHQEARADDAADLPETAGGGGESISPNSTTPQTETTAAGVVLDTIAAGLPLRPADRPALAGPIDDAVTAGWEPQVLAAHLLSDPPAKVGTPGGWLAYRLTGTHKATGAPVLPESPAVCACTACRRHVRQTELEIRRQAAELDRARQRDANQAGDDDGRRRYDVIAEGIGPVLHQRIVAAELDTIRRSGPYGAKIALGWARSPERVRGMVTDAYERHGYDLEAIRAYAEALPEAPGATETDAAGPSGVSADGWATDALRCAQPA